MLAKEYNTIEEAEFAAELMHEYCVNNVDGYNATKYADPYPYNEKFYIFIDSRLNGCEEALNPMELTIIIEDVI